MSFLTHQNSGLLWLSSSLLDGQPVAFQNATEARDRGISIVAGNGAIVKEILKYVR